MIVACMERVINHLKNIRMLDPVPSAIRDYVRITDVELRQNCDNLSAVLNEMCKDKNKKKCLSRLIHIHINMKNTVRTFLFYPGINTRVSKYNKTKLIDIFLKIATFP